MPLDQSIVGTTYPPSPPHEVGREKIREFADAIADAHPAFREPQAAHKLGYPDVIAPPTFPIVLTLDASTQVLAALGVKLHNVLHREQRFSYRRPIIAGDCLSCTVEVESLAHVAGNDVLTIRADITAITAEARRADAGAGETVAAPEAVAIVWSTLIIREEV